MGLQCHSLLSGQHSIGRNILSENKVWSLQLIPFEPSWLWESQCKFDFPLFSLSIPWWSSLRGQNNVFGRTKTVFNSPHFHFMVNLGFQKYSNTPLVPPKCLWSPCHGMHKLISRTGCPPPPPPSKNRKIVMLPHPDTAQDSLFQGCDWINYSLFIFQKKENNVVNTSQFYIIFCFISQKFLWSTKTPSKKPHSDVRQSSPSVLDENKVPNACVSQV